MPDVSGLLSTAWPDAGPWTRVVMLRALDGGVAGADKHSWSISNSTDRDLLGRTREFAHGILVGAGTMRVEPYGPPTVSPEVADQRARLGMGPAPRLVIATATLDLPWSEPALTDPRVDVRPVVVTGHDVPADRLDRAREQTEVISTHDLSARGILTALHGRGLTKLSCEGGPTLVREFLAADLVDEMILTVAPYAATWLPPSVARDVPPATPTRFDLAEVATADSYLYARYLQNSAETRSTP